MGRPVDPDLVEAVVRLAAPAGIRAAMPAINGSLLRWPDDGELLESTMVRHARGASPGVALRGAFTQTFAAMMDALDGLPEDAAQRQARQIAMFCGLDGSGAWLPLPARLAAMNAPLARPAHDDALVERVRALEAERQCSTAIAVVCAVAEVLAKQWAQVPPEPPTGPGTPAYKARLRAAIDADIRENETTLRWMDRLIALDAEEKARASLAETPAVP